MCQSFLPILIIIKIVDFYNKEDAKTSTHCANRHIFYKKCADGRCLSFLLFYIYSKRTLRIYIKHKCPRYKV